MKTQTSTIVALLAMLIEEHVARCNRIRVPGVGRVAHVISVQDETKAGVDTISNASNILTLSLSDGSGFLIEVNEV